VAALFLGLNVLDPSFVSSRRDIIFPPTDDAVAAAARSITRGRLIAFPTETVYGLGGDATDDRAVAAIFAAKDRPSFNPLIAHFANARAAAGAVAFDDRAWLLAEAFWPGALTLVLPRKSRSGISLLASAGLDTVAVRVPDHPVALALLKAAACPVAAPSANRSGHVSPTMAAHVAVSLGSRVDAILDGGRCAVGIESTVVDLSGDSPTLLRPGGVAAEDIEGVVGPLASPGGGAPKSPGMLRRHYAPGIPLRLDAREAGPGEVLLAFGPDAPDDAVNLSARGDVIEAAANLFAMVRALDRPENRVIAVMPVPERGLGRAINDRLRRASLREE
jgi:L-threonylcarbamoyladenylate synthase